jgi:hypothetical protein
MSYTPTAECSHLAEGIEDLVEVDEYLPLCNLCNVVHALTRIVANTGILVAKTCEHGRDDFFEIAGYFLRIAQSMP